MNLGGDAGDGAVEGRKVGGEAPCETGGDCAGCEGGLQCRHDLCWGGWWLVDPGGGSGRGVCRGRCSGLEGDRSLCGKCLCPGLLDSCLGRLLRNELKIGKGASKWGSEAGL